MVLMLVCSFDPFYIGPCPPGCLAPLKGGCCSPCCGPCCGPCGPCCSPCCSSCPCGW
ncbi:uncharacterized protein Dana_GF19688 [Drosophila ananassae]|uniref:Uncharacterized protein n=1 Tax=Drosophila ananassae TaxID=7217 RepID=B3MMF2_DROAN|nr:male-specific sperm protein Mst84Dd [Drosophila ananassae]EDV30898.1 uncharacterized protein Dana_GF19688 [Drosophila ananassae]KAH8323262.1 hypothetical protein KR067_003889 [Drosophila pandora]